ncbi:MAG: Flp family type IVb pilin [Hyphomicrobium sp.]|nr:Flp family type IVb pilin [Hyphomicrobium sp.]PPC81555.1 MAG: Flp family type IVb pilin [Hyphomicrobium sp.]
MIQFNETSGLYASFATDERGATSVEYTVIIATIALGIIGTVDDIGPALVVIFNNAAALLNAV